MRLSRAPGRGTCPCRSSTTLHGRARRRPHVIRCYLKDADRKRQRLDTSVAIVGSGPAAHTAAIYLARAELEPILLEGWMANGLPPGGQLTTTTFVENFPGFPTPIMGGELTERFRQQSVNYGTRIFTETVEHLELGQGPPFVLYTDSKEVRASSVIIATGAAARKLPIAGLDQYWNNGISACAVCDGSSPLFRNQPVAVVGGGDVAMEEALFLARYASHVFIVHRFDYLEASKVMARRALSHPKISVLWGRECVGAYGREDGTLAGIRIRHAQQPADGAAAINGGDGGSSGSSSQAGQAEGEEELPVSGLFFAIGHAPATRFLEGQLQLDDAGYIVTAPDSCATSVVGVFAAGDVQDRKWRQAITAAGSGCMAALEAERFLQALEDGPAGASSSTAGKHTRLDAAWAAQQRAQAQQQALEGEQQQPVERPDQPATPEAQRQVA